MRADAAILFLVLAAARPAVAEPRLSTTTAVQLDEGLKALYSLDYPQSRAAFHRLIELEPESPYGYLFEAGGIWWQSSQEYGLFQDTPTLQGVFEDDVDQALRRADAWIDSPDSAKKAAGYFASGMTLGIKGQWRLMKRHWMEAYFEGKKAIKHLKKCLKADPDFVDAHLGLGVFEYQTAHLSGIARLGILFGLRGNEKRGLEEIRLAADRSRDSGRQAAELLAQIDIVDRGDFADAQALLARLRRDFSGSPYFLFLEMIVRHRLGDWDGSLALGRELYRVVAADPASFRPKWLTLVCGLSGPDCLARPDVERGLAWIDHALAATSGEKVDGFQTLLRLFRGNALDVLNRREEAVAEYKRCLELPPFDFVHERAHACLAAPCGRYEIIGRLRALSKEGPAEAPRGNGIVTPER